MKSLRILFTLFLVSLAACSKQPVTEQSVSQVSEPPLVLKSYATVFGATVEGDHTVVPSPAVLKPVNLVFTIPIPTSYLDVR